jgi:hypothetical protein
LTCWLVIGLEPWQVARNTLALAVLAYYTSKAIDTGRKKGFKKAFRMIPSVHLSSHPSYISYPSLHNRSQLASFLGIDCFGAIVGAAIKLASAAPGTKGIVEAEKAKVVKVIHHLHTNHTIISLMSLISAYIGVDGWVVNRK